MKKIKKITSLLLTVILFSVTLALANPIIKTASAATNTDVPVQLYYAKTTFIGKYYHSISGYIAVKNIAYVKEVNVRYNKGDGTWGTIPASYVKNNTSDGLEVWSFNSDGIDVFCSATEFYIEYKVNGNTYYDSNYGNNYTIKPISGYSYIQDGYTFGKQKAVVTSIAKGSMMGYNQSAEVTVRVNSTTATTSSQKVTYNENNYGWQSTTVTSSLNSLADGSSEAVLRLPLIDGDYIPSNLQLAAAYTVNGITYWDNNFGSNYTATIQ